MKVVRLVRGVFEEEMAPLSALIGETNVPFSPDCPQSNPEHHPERTHCCVSRRVPHRQNLKTIVDANSFEASETAGLRATSRAIGRMASILFRRQYYVIFGVVAVLFLLFHNVDRDRLSWPDYAPDVRAGGSGNGGSGGSAAGPRPARWNSYRPNFPVPIDLIRQLPTGKPLPLPRIQHEFPTESDAERNERAIKQRSVKDAFVRCWTSYRSRAWMSDELTPISAKTRNHFGGWGATLVDSLDTLWIMEMKDEFDHAVAALSSISFDTTTLKSVNIFETNIRFLGGFLAAYDLSGDARLLEKAVEVGNMLYAAFDTPNRMPITRWNMRSAAHRMPQVADPAVLLAELGTFSLEFTRLSIVTGDPKWFDASQRIIDALHEQQRHTLLPGMWPMVVDAKNMVFNKLHDFTLGSMSDSLYEYLPKTYALLGGLVPKYRDMYEAAMDAAIRHNMFRPMVPDNADILVSGLVTAKQEDGKTVYRRRSEGQHLACYTGGMLAMGGKLFNNQTHLEKGEKLTNGCIWTYKAMPTGIMPETFFMLPCQSASHCVWDEARWINAVMDRAEVPPEEATPEKSAALISHKRLPKGFTAIPDTNYHLRPEAIESVFILYRITGRSSLLDSAWDMFRAIDTNTRTELANSALSDVTVTEERPPMTDTMESFWLGETLKYFYLIFSEPSLISLDEYVFNTEAHPFKRLLPS